VGSNPAGRARQRRELRRRGLRAPFSFVRILCEGAKVKTKKVNESSRGFFQNLRPKFLDWQPPTEEEKALPDLAKKRNVEKVPATRRRSPG
jgi:hypothetical protein